jgi:hypothetical protein
MTAFETTMAEIETARKKNAAIKEARLKMQDARNNLKNSLPEIINETLRAYDGKFGLRFRVGCPMADGCRLEIPGVPNLVVAWAAVCEDLEDGPHVHCVIQGNEFCVLVEDWQQVFGGKMASVIAKME